MSIIKDDLSDRIAKKIQFERAERGWSLADVASRSGVSKAMISKVERCETSPTAVVLSKLAGAFGLTLSAFLVEDDDPASRVSRAELQSTWVDPASGYTRTMLSPTLGGAIELVKITLPAKARIAFPAQAYAPVYQLVWVISGCLRVQEGEVEHTLEAGDCLELGPAADCVFENPTGNTIDYLTMVTKRR
ncbi:helix-turn-helix domain-containing protein [Pelagibius sp.]|uniref:helix-turn-helix domain-containing protein n=1 Tax=Pelagibius sp. TaxID=1931238 RepID=UPI003BAE6AE4